MDFNGIYTPVITPHFDDYSIDEAGFAEVIEGLISDGVHGIIIAGTTGEYYAQTMEERQRMLHLGVEIINGRVPSIGGTGALRTEDSITLAQTAKSWHRCDVVARHILSQRAEKMPSCPRGRRAVDMPVMLYNYPGRMAARWMKNFR